MILSIMSRSMKCGAPTNPPVPNIRPNPISQNNIEPTMKSTRFFIKMLAVFFIRVNPASTNANPGCMKNTSIAARSIQTVFKPVASSAVASAPAPSSCADKANGISISMAIAIDLLRLYERNLFPDFSFIINILLFPETIHLKNLACFISRVRHCKVLCRHALRYVF